ncbi:hypothetical protein [Natronolimnohabitans innermongolicus]|uniref:Uncharacterized protein n=1 Tax=Natronolimnohabitans innermongolicus JCM 12255 TaxID=1227499 RepID=L9XKQ4_9EURY|nr:hypothetical protein [Natronolimnohabitans innermongolicus]ELY61213.1 hypothetical protein C493_02828 [Natronolimnohabitans innermongolicus JCM 12255]
MSWSESESRIVAVCRACESVFVSEQRPDGTIRPIGVSEECTCGNGDFKRVAPSGDGETPGTDDDPSERSASSMVRPPSD